MIKLTIQKSIDGEYRVAVFNNGVLQEGPTYYASDLMDAKETRLCMAKEKPFLDAKLTKSIQRNKEF